MAHNITERDGMFTVREPAWHGLGNVLTDYPTRAEAQAIAHPWEPEPEELYRRRLVPQTFGPPKVEYYQVEGYYANVRSDDQHLLGVVPQTFNTVSNNEMYEIAEAIEGEAKGDVQFETGGSLKGGSKVWLLLRLREPLVVPGDTTAVIPYWAMQNSHDGSGSFRGQCTLTRIVCDNTSQAADLDAQARGTEFVFRHTKNVRDRIDQAREALAGWRVSLDNWQQQMTWLQREVKLDGDQVADFIKLFIPMPAIHSVSTRVVNNVERGRASLRAIIDGPTCEGIADTGYGMVQASIEYLNHSRRAASAESRFKRSYLDREVIVSDAVRIVKELANV